MILLLARVLCTRDARVATVVTLGTFAIAILISMGPAVAQDRMELGPRQFERDGSGAGAVLCAWSIYLSVQTQTAACALSRRPTDDAIDEAIVAIDEFILANSSLHPTRAALDAFKRRAAETELNAMRRRGLQKVCENGEIEHFRKPSPDQIRSSVKALLAVPREPVMNPCL